MAMMCPWCFGQATTYTRESDFSPTECAQCHRKIMPGELLFEDNVRQVTTLPRWATRPDHDSAAIAMNGRSLMVYFALIWNLALAVPVYRVWSGGIGAFWGTGAHVFAVLMALVFVLAAAYGAWQLAILVVGRLESRVVEDRVSIFWGIAGLGCRRTFELADIAHVVRTPNRTPGMYRLLIITPSESRRIAPWFPSSRVRLMQAWLCSMRRSTLRLQGLCPTCSYDLRATPVGNPCPECGNRSPDPSGVEGVGQRGRTCS